MGDKVEQVVTLACQTTLRHSARARNRPDAVVTTHDAGSDKREHEQVHLGRPWQSCSALGAKQPRARQCVARSSSGFHCVLACLLA
jgi:hypothetical protein